MGTEKLEFSQQILFKHYMPAPVSGIRDSTKKTALILVELPS